MRTAKKKDVIFIATSLFFLIFCTSGCEQLQTEKDQLTVNVMVAVYINLVDENNQPIEQNMDGAVVSIEIIKNQKDRFVYDRILQKGICQATASFSLTKGQFIECTATVPTGYQGFYPIAPAYSLLTWETAEASASMMNVYNWYCDMIIIMKQ